ncbi:unnamed protein product [Linum trigynum]|uniref:B-like cyclin n=1 Tax=Linum trigynum TaxID=586398 RepID=A0AAV2FCA5_9ROSI
MADDLLCHEDIFLAASTPSQGGAAAEPPSGADGDVLTEVRSKYEIGGDGDEEFVRFLVEKETAHGYGVGQSVDFDVWVSGVRTEAIDWFFNTRASLGLRWKTAHLSVTHFDRFLSKFVIEPHRIWVARLLQLACLSLAAKMEETDSPSLSLPSYQVHGWSFGYEAIARMEFQVLTKLGFRLNTPSPFDYIPCFLIKAVEVCPPMETVSRITKLILALTRVVNLRNHRPSSIAIAAIMAALDQNMEADALMSRLNTFAYAHLLDIGNAVECYNLMNNLDMEDAAEIPVVSPDVSPARFDGSSSSAADYLGNVKRRRLDFDRPPDRPPDLL